MLKIDKKTISITTFCLFIILTIVYFIYFYASKAGKLPDTKLNNQLSKISHQSATSAPDQTKQQKLEPEKEIANTETVDVELEDNELSPEEKLNSLLGALNDKIKLYDEEFNFDLHSADAENAQERFELVNQLLENPELIDGVLNQFLDNPSSYLGLELSAVLADVGTPEIQQAALNLGLDPHSGDAESRGMALLLVSDIDEITPDTRDRLLDSYAAETDTDLLQFSLMALKPAVSTQEDLARVQSTLTEVIQHDNSDVRRHALYQQGEWATSNEELSLIRDLALSEKDDNARFRAIDSIAQSQFQSDENRAVLNNVINNENEFSIVRRNALNALKKYPLSSSEAAELNALSDRIAEQVKIDFGQ